jgi:hypothetical protein
MGKLEELGQQLEEASKNCDTEKLGVLAEACGQSIGAQMKSCTGECKELFKFMGEEGGCGGTFRQSLRPLRFHILILSHSLDHRLHSTPDLYDQFGLGDIEELCNGADIGDIVADVPVITTGVDDSGTDMPSPDSTPDSATTTTVPSKPDIISETTSGSMAGVVVATSVAILAIV